MEFIGHTGAAITSVAFNVDGRTIFTGCEDNTAYLWRNFNWNKETKELFVKYYPLLRKSYIQESVPSNVTESKEDTLEKAEKETVIQKQTPSDLDLTEFDASFIDTVNLDEQF